MAAFYVFLTQKICFSNIFLLSLHKKFLSKVMESKKNIEMPKVEVSVADKPKKTKKKSTTSKYDVDAVITEITDKKSTVSEATTAITNILKSKEQKNVSTFRRINDDGVVNMSEFTKKEIDEYFLNIQKVSN